MKSFAKNQTQNINKQKENPQDSFHLYSSSFKSKTENNQIEVNSLHENKSLLKQKQCQDWLRKRYREKANINYLWHAHQIYDQQLLDGLVSTIIQNQSQINQNEIKQEQQNEDQKINLDAIYNVAKQVGENNFMNRKSFNDIMNQIDRDGDGKISKSQFEIMLMSRTINQKFQQLNQEQWKKCHIKQTNQKQEQRNRFKSVDQSTDKLKQLKENSMNNPINLPAIKISKNTQDKIILKRRQNSSQINPTNSYIANISQECLNTNTDVNNNSLGRQENKRFSEVDLTRILGNLKYENERSKLIKDFEHIRNNKSVDIGEKCDKLNEIIKQKHFIVDNIGVTPQQRLLSKAKLQQIRQRYHSSSRARNNQSHIDLYENSIQLPDINQNNEITTKDQSRSIFPSINIIKNRTNPQTFNSFTNLITNTDDISTHDENNTNQLHSNYSGNKFEYINYLTDVNLEENIKDNIFDSQNQIEDKLNNNNHHNYKKQLITQIRRKQSKQNSLSTAFPSQQSSQIYLNTENSNKRMCSKSTLDMSQTNIIESDIDENKEPDQNLNKYELGMIVERAKYIGKKQAQNLSQLQKIK